MSNIIPIQQPRQKVTCKCKNVVFDGLVIKQISVIRLLPHVSQGKCKRCKAWVNLPIIFKT